MLKRDLTVKFRTIVEFERPEWGVSPSDRILCVGSCFAQRIGDVLADYRLRAEVNPWGTLYNPASIAMALEGALGGEATVERVWMEPVDVLIVTFGTTHVYEREGRVVANCQKLPARLFTERELSVGEIVDGMGKAIGRLRERNRDLRVVFTVSPYRYAKYGFHGSQLSKARLLMATEELVRTVENAVYFPAYEIVLDELRDYRFYDADMLHPSRQAVEYIWERFEETMLTADCRAFVKEIEPVRKALKHKPFDAESEEYKRFLAENKAREAELIGRYINKENKHL